MTKDFILADSKEAAGLYVDTQKGSKAYKGIAHAAENLQGDIHAITGIEPAFGLAATSLIAGNIGESPIIDKLIADGRLDVSAIEGKWESYTTSVIDNPAANVNQAFVIAGSDMRGTIFGIYKVCETIGVSPWSFFADSKPARRDTLLLSSKTIVQGEPSVKYRGIFINDERSLERWMNQYAKDNKHTQTLNKNHGAYWLTHEFYVKVFDMILRQYGNYLWPAMWHNSFWMDDPLNGELASAYGIVIGTSHQEFMNCPDKEWVWSNLGDFQWIDSRYPQPENWVYKNKEAMIKKWTQTMTATKDFETIVNMGLRGLSDVAIFPNGTKEQNILLLNDVIKEQRKIIQDVHKSTDIPQSVIIYKEVEAFYYGDDAANPNSGWKASIADDITVILCDDNFGNVRGLPMDINRNRSGGFGMYYHFDYNGSPRSYRWKDSTPLEKTREQMTMAYDYGVDRIWVVNAGDIKFNEAAIDYWFKLAHDIKTWGEPDGPEKARKDFAAKEFGEELADDIAEILSCYTQLNNVRKPDIVLNNTFSLTYFNEAESLLAKYINITTKALTIKKQIPQERKDAYYNLVLHPAIISCNAWELMINLAKNQACHDLGLTIVNDYANIAKECLQFDNFCMFYTYGAPGLSDEDYYCVGNGKYYGYYPRREKEPPFDIVKDESIYYLATTEWNHRTTQFAFAETGNDWNRLYNVIPEQTPQMVVLPQPWLDKKLPAAKTDSIALPAFTSYGNETRYIDIANTAETPFDYTITANDPWIILRENRGTVDKIDRVYVSIDAKRANANGSITIAGANAKVTVNVSVEIFDTSALPHKTFVETDGYISILSTSYAKSIAAEKDGINYQWTQLLGYGREGASMKVMPTALNAGYGKGRTPGLDSPYLEYNVYIKTPGEIDIITQWAPTNGMDPRQLNVLQYGVSLGEDEPQIVNTLSQNYSVENSSDTMWADGVENAVHTMTLRSGESCCMSRHKTEKPGVYTLRIYMVNDGLTLQKILVGTENLERTTVDTAPACTVPTILTGSLASITGTNAAYLGPPESYCHIL